MLFSMFLEQFSVAQLLLLYLMSLGSTNVFSRSTIILANCHAMSKDHSIVRLVVLELFMDFEIVCVCPSLKNYIRCSQLHQLHA
jgi:hypothetical protein